MPSRIVTATYRYKRPPRKKKPVLLEVPVIVTKRASRQQASTPKPAGPANDDRKPISRPTITKALEICDAVGHSVAAELAHFERNSAMYEVFDSFLRADTW